MTNTVETIRQNVQSYYGETLQKSDDLQTNACCPTEAMPPYLRPLLQNIAPAIRDKFYGCGSPIPHALNGCNVLDLGCGTGRDVYLLAQLVGENGHVHGVDMTEAQLAVAREHSEAHRQAFGYATPNVSFYQGYMEDLAALGLADNSMDVVVSNCVLNLSTDKAAVFREIFRVLKPGGELYFADIFANRRIADDLAHDPVLHGECLGGAMYREDFRRLLTDLGCADVRFVATSPVTIENPELEQKLSGIRFTSETVRAFKVPLEDRCEDFGHTATYQGSIAESPDEFRLDDHHLFAKGKAVPVCGNTANMLAQSRFAPHFNISGNFSTHRGLFDCTEPAAPITSGGCC